jgi:hypothetical protein
MPISDLITATVLKPHIGKLLLPHVKLINNLPNPTDPNIQNFKLQSRLF